MALPGDSDPQVRELTERRTIKSDEAEETQKEEEGWSHGWISVSDL